MMSRTLWWLALAMAVAAQSAAGAPWRPTDTVTLISHSSPGTGNDLMLRQIANIWQKYKLVGQQVVVENMTGGRGAKARRFVSRQNRGNGNVLLVLTPQTINQPILHGTEKRISKAFTPIAILNSAPALVAVNASAPYRSLKDLIDAAKAKPKSVLQGGGSFGNSASILGHTLAKAAGVEFTYVPFKGAGTAIEQLLGSHVDFVIENPSELHPLVAGGKLRVLAATEPMDLFPGVPTFAQAGYKFHILTQFLGILGPPGIGRNVVNFYLDALKRARETPEWKQYVKNGALVDEFLVGAKLKNYIEEEEDHYARVDREMGLLK